MDRGDADRVKVVWADGSEKFWHNRDNDLDLRKEYDIPTEAMWELMMPLEKIESLSRLLLWADNVGVPNNSQIREMLGGFVRTLSQEMIRDSQSEWKKLIRMAPGGQAFSQTSPLGFEKGELASRMTIKMRFL